MTHQRVQLGQNTQQWLDGLQTNGHSLQLDELLAYRQLRTLGIAKKSSVPARGQGGGHLSRLKGRGMEFDEVRHYQSGDDIRAIDWRVTARTGQTYTKLFREEKERPVFFFVDISPSMQFGTRLLYKSVQAAHLSAALAWQFAYRGDRVGGLVFNSNQHRELKPAGRDKGVLRLLQALVSVQQSAPTERPDSRSLFSENIQRMRRLVKTGAQVYLISDFHQLTDESVRDLRALSQHNAIQAILVQDPLERALPHVSPSRVQAKDSSFTREFWLGDKRTEKVYQKQAVAWLEKRVSILKQARIPSTLIDTSMPLSLQWQELV